MEHLIVHLAIHFLLDHKKSLRLTHEDTKELIGTLARPFLNPIRLLHAKAIPEPCLAARTFCSTLVLVRVQPLAHQISVCRREVLSLIKCESRRSGFYDLIANISASECVFMHDVMELSSLPSSYACCSRTFAVKSVPISKIGEP